jgi:hypothetical protein
MIPVWYIHLNLFSFTLIDENHGFRFRHPSMTIASLKNITMPWLVYQSDSFTSIMCAIWAHVFFSQILSKFCLILLQWRYFSEWSFWGEICKFRFPTFYGPLDVISGLTNQDLRRQSAIKWKGRVFRPTSCSSGVDCFHTLTNHRKEWALSSSAVQKNHALGLSISRKRKNGGIPWSAGTVNRGCKAQFEFRCQHRHCLCAVTGDCPKESSETVIVKHEGWMYNL